MRTDINKSDARILFEAEILYDYPKVYLPESIYSKHTEELPVDIDRYVKHYMIWFGIDNVRGGSYLNPELPDYQKKTLQEEMNTAAVEDDLSALIEYANQPHTKAEIESRLEQVKYNYAKYCSEKALEINVNVNSIRHELDWLKTQCNNQDNPNSSAYLCKLEKAANAKRYRKLLPQLRRIREIIQVLDIDITNPLILHPEFVYDDFIYHHHRTHLCRSLENMYFVFRTYYKYLDTVENRKAERDFDIASWGPVSNMKNEIYLLTRLLQ